MDSSSGDFLSDLRVLVVDGDKIALNNIETTLKKFNYQVTTCYSTREAMDMLRRHNNEFKIVMSDVNNLDYDFQFLKYVSSNLGLPVIMMSKNDGEMGKVVRGVRSGACEFLVKPIPDKKIQYIWQHALIKKRMQLNKFKKAVDKKINEATPNKTYPREQVAANLINQRVEVGQVLINPRVEVAGQQCRWFQTLSPEMSRRTTQVSQLNGTVRQGLSGVRQGHGFNAYPLLTNNVYVHQGHRFNAHAYPLSTNNVDLAYPSGDIYREIYIRNPNGPPAPQVSLEELKEVDLDDWYNQYQWD